MGNCNITQTDISHIGHIISLPAVYDLNTWCKSSLFVRKSDITR